MVWVGRDLKDHLVSSVRSDSSNYCTYRNEEGNFSGTVTPIWNKRLPEKKLAGFFVRTPQTGHLLLPKGVRGARERTTFPAGEN